MAELVRNVNDCGLMDLRDRTARLERENKAFRLANASLDREMWRLRDLLSEIDAELDRQLYDEEHVKSCRDNDLDIPPDCEHHVVIRQALREKIAEAAAPVRDTVSTDHEPAF